MKYAFPGMHSGGTGGSRSVAMRVNQSFKFKLFRDPKIHPLGTRVRSLSSFVFFYYKSATIIDLLIVY
jgi:hypothetical protein